jgi:hypothetical protein
MIVAAGRIMQTLSYMVVELGEPARHMTRLPRMTKIVDLACPQRINHAV